MSLAVKVKALISGQSGLRSRSRSRRFVRKRETLDLVETLVECFGAVFMVELETAGGVTRKGACSGLPVLAGPRPNFVLAYATSEESVAITEFCHVGKIKAQGAC